VNISVIFEENRAKIGYVIPGWYVYMPHRAVVTFNFMNPKPNPKKKRNYERNVLINSVISGGNGAGIGYVSGRYDIYTPPRAVVTSNSPN
jgi:hypothetical protein